MNKEEVLNTIIEKLCKIASDLKQTSDNMIELTALITAVKTSKTSKRKEVCSACGGDKGWFSPGLGRGQPERWIPCRQCSKKTKKAKKILLASDYGVKSYRLKKILELPTKKAKRIKKNVRLS